jgi:hypothetical protein
MLRLLMLRLLLGLMLNLLLRLFLRLLCLLCAPHFESRYAQTLFLFGLSLRLLRLLCPLLCPPHFESRYAQTLFLFRKFAICISTSSNGITSGIMIINSVISISVIRIPIIARRPRLRVR